MTDFATMRSIRTELNGAFPLLEWATDHDELAVRGYIASYYLLLRPSRAGKAWVATAHFKASHDTIGEASYGAHPQQALRAAAVHLSRHLSALGTAVLRSFHPPDAAQVDTSVELVRARLAAQAKASLVDLEALGGADFLF